MTTWIDRNHELIKATDYTRRAELLISTIYTIYKLGGDFLGLSTGMPEVGIRPKALQFISNMYTYLFKPTNVLAVRNTTALALAEEMIQSELRIRKAPPDPFVYQALVLYWEQCRAL